jgi:hypothetical protein
MTLMHESIRSVRWSWVGFGWFLAAAVTSLILLALEAFSLIRPDTAAETLWVALALLTGFFLAGLLVGTRVAAAPLLHGLGMGACSIAVWLAINLLVGEPAGETTWRSLDAAALAGLLLLQAVAAVVGTRIGVRWVRSRPSLH